MDFVRVISEFRREQLHLTACELNFWANVKQHHVSTAGGKPKLNLQTQNVLLVLIICCGKEGKCCKALLSFAG